MTESPMSPPGAAPQTPRATGAATTPGDGPAEQAERPAPKGGAAATDAIFVCPYLFVPGASWRATRPLREHRCQAVSPVDAPSAETQRGVCLTSAHVICTRYEAALEARRARWSGPADGLAAFEARVDRRVPRVTPVALDRPSAIAGPLSLLGGGRRLARIALAAAMIGAAALLFAARFAGGGAGGGVRTSPEPTMPAVLASPTGALASGRISPSLPVTSTPSPSPGDGAGTGATSGRTPRPSASRTYRVKSGDTLSGIARRFGTTVAALKRLNGIGGSTRIHPGQVLRIP